MIISYLRERADRLAELRKNLTDIDAMTCIEDFVSAAQATHLLNPFEGQINPINSINPKNPNFLYLFEDKIQSS